MTPYGHHPQQPPAIVGTCLRCSQVIYQGQPFVAYQAGPVHPQCNEAMTRKKVASPAMWFAGIGVIVLAFGGLMCVSAIAGSAKPQPETSPQLSAGDHAWMWREDFTIWHPPICPTEEGFDAYRQAREDADQRAALQAFKCFTVKPNTEVIVLGIKPTRVKVANGTHVSKSGYTGSAWVQRTELK